MRSLFFFLVLLSFAMNAQARWFGSEAEASAKKSLADVEQAINHQAVDATASAKKAKATAEKKAAKAKRKAAEAKRETKSQANDASNFFARKFEQLKNIFRS